MQPTTAAKPDRGLSPVGVISDIDMDGNFVIRHVQDCDPILDVNKASQAQGRSAWGMDPDMWKVASIPNVVIIKWLNDHGVNFYDNNHWPHVKRLLNSSEYAWLRTGGGRL